MHIALCMFRATLSLVSRKDTHKINAYLPVFKKDTFGSRNGSREETEHQITHRHLFHGHLTLYPGSGL